MNAFVKTVVFGHWNMKKPSGFFKYIDRVFESRLFLDPNLSQALAESDNGIVCKQFGSLTYYSFFQYATAL